MNIFTNLDKLLSQQQINELDSILIDSLYEYGVDFDYYDNLTIEFNFRLRTVGGRFCWNTLKFNQYKNSKIELNPKNFEKFGFESIKKTFLHEVAHLIQLVVEGDTTHDRSFKHICSNIGGSMNTKHAGEEFKENRTTDFIKSKFKWNYKCSCGANNFNYKRRAGLNLRSGLAVCTNCGSKLTETKL